MHPVLLIGWDGASFDLIRPWVAQGKLPTLSKLMEEGVHSSLLSTIPPWSFQAWTSFMTGKNPGKHGVYDFFRTPVGTYDLEFVNANQRRGGPTVWQLLSDAGRQVVSISIPGTFPPEPVNGVMISGFDFPGEGPGSHVDAKGMYPPELCEELQSAVGRYPIDPPILKEMEQGHYDVALKRIIETIREQAAAAKYLIRQRPWDCFMMVFGESDGVAHYFWQFCDPRSPFFVPESNGLQDSLLEVYEELDRQLAELLSLTPPATNVIVLSDHGCGGVSDWVLFPNVWLKEKGVLDFRGAASRRLSRLREAAKHWGVKSLPTFVQRLLYRNAVRALGRFESRVRYGILDWSRTEAYFDENPYHPVLRVNVRGREPRGIVEPGASYERLRDRLIEELEGWRHPHTGERVVEKAYRREEVYCGPFLEEAADIIPKWALCQGNNYGFRLSSKAPPAGWIARIDGPTSPYCPRKFCSHRDNAILVARGPAFRSGNLCDNDGDDCPDPRIVDLAPTILSLLGLPVPEDMDGRVLDELFAEERLTDAAVPSRRTA
jgi:predicted AlkP superfamily phosphohydrolase/phosphomutase